MNYAGLDLPENELAMFAFPQDLSLRNSEPNRFPLPIFFTFVFTNDKGDHLYAACLQFYEKVRKYILPSITIIATLIGIYQANAYLTILTTPSFLFSLLPWLIGNQRRALTSDRRSVRTGLPQPPQEICGRKSLCPINRLDLLLSEGELKSR